MTKKIISIVSVALMSLSLNAADSFYVGASLGYLFDAEEMGISGRVGLILLEEDGFRHSVEAEIMHSDWKSHGVTVRLLPMLINYRGEFDLNNDMFLYFGAGLGSSRVSVKFDGFSESENEFTYQVFGGAGLRLTEELSLVGGVNYLKFKDLGDDTTVSVGLQYRF